MWLLDLVNYWAPGSGLLGLSLALLAPQLAALWVVLLGVLLTLRRLERELKLRPCPQQPPPAQHHPKQ